MRAINATHVLGAPEFRRAVRCTSRARTFLLLLAALALVLIGAPAAFAGQASTGQLAFYPCSQCHPVTVDAGGTPSHPLPIGLKKHEVALEVHDVLGTDEKACLACHDDPSRNPGMLALPDGSLVEITGDISRVCQRCHMEKYREWTEGIHGKKAPKCTASGCHDPHTPSWIYIQALPPFQGTGVQVRAVTNREPFKPLAGPPVPPPVLTPTWLVVMTLLGTVLSLGMVGYLVKGRAKR